jgi:hypothetical protein
MKLVMASCGNVFTFLKSVEMKNDKIVSWWSGGVTSAVTCYLCIQLFGLKNCEFIFIDTFNEDDDTYRFKKDCEKWYGKKIKTITGIGKGKYAVGTYKSIVDVWYKYKSLNIAHGAICSSELKRDVRLRWERDNAYKHQAFGFDINEPNRAKSLSLNYPKSKPIFPLLLFGLQKQDCLELMARHKVQTPRMYALGFQNNNCFGKTATSIGGCIQGGIGYWQKMAREYPKKFDKMAAIEHDLTDLKGEPVTMLKDQSAEAIKTGNRLVFLKPHKDYPHLKDLSMMKGREPKPLMECNGFCSTNDLEDPNPTEKEINYNQQSLF